VTGSRGRERLSDFPRQLEVAYFTSELQDLKILY
jgi:hypothetical protein